MTGMVTATEFAKNFGRYTDKAIADRVVEVSSNGRPIGAFLSQEEYERYLELRRRSARAFAFDDLPEDIREDFERGMRETGELLEGGGFKGPKE